MKDSSFFETSPANSLRQSLGRVGQWFRLDGMILVLPDNEVEPDHEMRAMVSRGARRLPNRRILAYTTKDVIDNRISVPAQHSLVRLSKNPVTNADAVGMLDEIKNGRLAGIFCVNWKIPAQRALRLGLSWWAVIPKSEDAVLMLDPDNPLSGPPLIAFRRELDTRDKDGCGKLPNEKWIAPSPARLDAALHKVWSTYLLFHGRRLARCAQTIPGDGVITAEVFGSGSLTSKPISNVVPAILCINGKEKPGFFQEPHSAPCRSPEERQTGQVISCCTAPMLREIWILRGKAIKRVANAFKKLFNPKEVSGKLAEHFLLKPDDVRVKKIQRHFGRMQRVMLSDEVLFICNDLSDVLCKSGGKFVHARSANCSDALPRTMQICGDYVLSTTIPGRKYLPERHWVKTVIHEYAHLACRSGAPESESILGEQAEIIKSVKPYPPPSAGMAIKNADCYANFAMEIDCRSC